MLAEANHLWRHVGHGCHPPALSTFRPLDSWLPLYPGEDWGSYVGVNSVGMREEEEPALEPPCTQEPV